MTIRQISAGIGISLSTLTGCLEIINDSPASSVMLNNVECSPPFSPANEVTLIGNNTGPDLTLKQLRAGDGVSLDDSSGCIEITSIMEVTLPLVQLIVLLPENHWWLMELDQT